MSAKDKSNLGKRGKTGKQRRDDSDSFDSRNQYTAYWGPQQQTWVPQPQYMTPPNPQYGAQGPPPAPYQGQMGPVYAQQGPGYPAMPGMVPNQPYPPYAMPPVCCPNLMRLVVWALTPLSMLLRPTSHATHLMEVL
jgi:hypothetical protein